MNQARTLNTSHRKKGYICKRLKESWQWYLLLLPGLIYLIIFEYGPMYGVQIAFKNYRASKGIWGSDWVGLKHFIRFFQYPNFLENDSEYPVHYIIVSGHLSLCNYFCTVFK